MPRPPKEEIEDRLAVACINGAWYNATALTMGFLEYTLDASTLYRKRCEINSFLAYLEKGIFSFPDSKIPCAVLFEWLAIHLEENPLVKGAAINKLVAVTQALVLSNLMIPEPLFAHKYDMMKKLVISLAKNLQASKAKALCITNPFALVPKYVHRLLATWLTTGVRFISIPEIDRVFQLDPELPFEAASTSIWQKTIVPSCPFVLCLCDAPELVHCCPIHTAPLQLTANLSTQANVILRQLRITRHTFRRTLALAFRIHSKYLNHPALKQSYLQFLYKIFGWRPPRKGVDKCMFQYYTSDFASFQNRPFPAVTLKVVRFYDDMIPILTGTPFYKYLRRVRRLN